MQILVVFTTIPTMSVSLNDFTQVVSSPYNELRLPSSFIYLSDVQRSFALLIQFLLLAASPTG